MNQVPRVKIAQLPTPLQALPRLSVELGGPSLWVKRDDQTGLALGGNKTRKLELLVAEAQANGARTLITAGAVQSNHCRQTAAAAARYGFDCILVLTGERPRRASGNLLLDQLLGAEIVWGAREERETLLEKTFQEAWNAGRRPYLVPYGGSSPVGAAAYALAFMELVEQCREAPFYGKLPEAIVFASSSGGTHAGLALGARLAGYSGSVLGISIDEEERVLQDRVARLAEQAGEYLGEMQRFSAEDIHVNAGYLGGGYGVLGDVEREAVRLFASREGLLLDPVYTGRAGGGLVDLIRKRYFHKEQTVLFWHTGGQPALFADRYEELAEEL
ncbi:MAG: D-cysteine desulfhydrase family protein [Chloroflexi bacterium]|nr:D-cysteine desulfhydrase family protein [Chloroflexota bacterium]